MAKLQAILRKYAIAPGMMEIEITEGLLIASNSSALPILNQLKDLGLVISLDDFGTGYSSLNYLKQFPIDVIKIDRSFTQDIDRDRQSTVIIETLIHLAQKLGLKIVAEGIELEAQARTLVEKGCYQGQGFLFSKPVPAAAAYQFIQQCSTTPGKTGNGRN